MPAVQVVGVHVHLTYAAADRVPCSASASRARTPSSAGHSVGFVDLGGGVPMSYLATAQSGTASGPR